MLINSATLNRVYQNLDKSYQDAYKAVQKLHPAFTMQVPSSTRSNLYAWLGMLPQVREWLGERQAASIGTRTYELVNKHWELSFAIDRNDVEDNTFFSFSTVAAQIGEQFAKHPDKLVASVIEAGLTDLCFDGQQFFDTDHPINPDGGAGTYSNKLTTKPLSFANYNTARVTMMSYKAEDGTPLAPPTDLILMVPPALELTAKQIVESEWISAGAYGAAAANAPSANPFKGSAKVLTNPYLSSDSRWYLLNVSSSIKPFVLQTRKAPEFVALDRPDDANVFAKKQFIYGSDARYAAGYTFPFLAITADQ